MRTVFAWGIALIALVELVILVSFGGWLGYGLAFIPMTALSMAICGRYLEQVREDFIADELDRKNLLG